MKLIFALMVLLVAAAGCAVADECNETVVIDSVEYNVGERWCGQRLDSTAIADPTTLVRIPEQFCFEESRIYVRREVRDAFVLMAEAAAADSVDLIADSGYRSATFQARIISRRMEEGDIFERLIRFVAPPGYSQHETGRALDLVPSEARFIHTPTYKWLKEKAAEFGFVESLPEDTSGFAAWESWHWYYLPEIDGANPSPAID